MEGYCHLQSGIITELVTVWIVEASGLPAADVLTNAFSLVFNGNPVPDLGSQVLKIVKCDATWQSTFR